MDNLYNLLDENLHRVPEEWFVTELSRSGGKNFLKAFRAEEVDVLRAYHNGNLSVDDAAKAITGPVSTSSPVDGDSDSINGLYQLWDLMREALVEWPSHLTPSLITLLVAISKVPDLIHRGEALVNGEPYSWDELPFFNMVWFDHHWKNPENIVKECPDIEARIRSRTVYLKIQDAEAQITAAGLFGWTNTTFYVIVALEQLPPPDGEDRTSTVPYSLHSDFQVPAVHLRMKYLGQKLYECVSKDNLEHWHRRDKSHLARHFENPKDRWAFWKKRLLEISQDAPDDFTQKEARETFEAMEAIEASAEGQKQ